VAVGAFAFGLGRGLGIAVGFTAFAPAAGRDDAAGCPLLPATFAPPKPPRLASAFPFVPSGKALSEEPTPAGSIPANALVGAALIGSDEAGTAPSGATIVTGRSNLLNVSA